MAETMSACVQVRRCLGRMQLTMASRALATWQDFTEGRAAQRRALKLHAARVLRRGLSGFQVFTLHPLHSCL